MTTQQFIKTAAFWQSLHNLLNETDIIGEHWEFKQVALSVSAEMMEHANKQEATPEEQMVEIFNRICDEYMIDPDEVRQNNKNKKREYVEIRQMCFYAWNRKNLKVSLAKAGRFFGKDHATALHGIRTIKNLRQTDKGIRQKADKILG
jgi:chromosomal replication initiation ATPase DnaA